MSTIALNPAELRSLVQDAVNDAFQQNLGSIADYMEEEAVIDRNLARLIEEARHSDEPTIPGAVFRHELEARIASL